MKIRKILSALMTAVICMTTLICGSVTAEAENGNCFIEIDSGFGLTQIKIKNFKYFPVPQLFRGDSSLDPNDKTAYVKVDFGDYYFLDGEKKDYIYEKGSDLPVIECSSYQSSSDDEDDGMEISIFEEENLNTAVYYFKKSLVNCTSASITAKTYYKKAEEYKNVPIKKIDMPEIFKNTAKIKKKEITVSGKKIEFSAYSDRTDITDVIIKDGVKSIGSFAFSGCVNLETVVIPESVTKIEDFAFFIDDSHFTIYGKEGSYAEKYAKKNHFAFSADKPSADGSSDTSSSKPSVPSDVKASKSASGKAKITWGKTDGADGYAVYMASSENGKYKKVKTVKKASTTSYTKSKLTAGKTYYFKVRSYKTVNGKKVYSKYSKTVKVKV